MALTELPTPIESFLRRFAARRCRLALLRAAGRAAVLGLAWMLLACLGDRLLRFPPAVRLALLAGCVAVIASMLAMPLWRMLLGRIDWAALTAQIERLNPVFGQRLQTIVSQMLEPHHYRGSEQMLHHLVEQVSQQAHDTALRWPAWRGVIGPWAAATLVMAMIVLLGRNTTLGLPSLIGRFLRPLAPISVVTTTQITVTPLNCTVMRGQSLSIRAAVRHLNGTTVEIYTSQDAKSWSRIPMMPAADNEYAFSLSGMDRDIWYYVKAGDATTPTYKASVLRPPAIAEYRIRYDYPMYTQRGTITLSNTDGMIEALVGTKVELTLTATEPLRRATVSIAGKTIPLAITGEQNTCQGRFVITASQHAAIELISAGGLLNKLTPGLTIRAQPDRAPMARLLQPADDLRLQPRDLLPIQYQAMDDYGVMQLSASLQKNAQAAVEWPIPRRGDPRRQEGEFSLDLAALNLSVGDILTVALVAMDGAGMSARSEPRRILISPRSIDMNTHQRIAELKQATLLAASWRDELRQSAQSLDNSRRDTRGESERVNERMRVSRALANAMEAGLMLHQSLIRVCARSAWPAQTVALAQYVDQARKQLSTCEHLANLESTDANEQLLADRQILAITDANTLADAVKTLAEGEQSAALLADRNNLRQSAKAAGNDPAAAQRLRVAVERARQEISQAVEQLGLSPGAGDLDARLQRRVDAAARLVASAKVVDFSAAAGQFVLALTGAEGEFSPLPERLASAAAVEAVRPDGDPVCARDLQLASRAASHLAEAQVAAGESAAFRDALSQLPRVLADLQREHAANRQAAIDLAPPADPSPLLLEARRQGAIARAKLMQWAGQTDLGRPAGANQNAAPEDLALQASAQTAQHNYEPAVALDRQLLGTLRNPGPQQAAIAQDLNRAMAAAAAIDQASSVHQQLKQETTSAPSPLLAASLATRQKQVASAIAQISQDAGISPGPAASDDQWRQKAMATVQKIQEQLAHMPQQMTLALEAADSHRQATAYAQDAQRQARSAPPDMRALARRLADQAQMAMEETQEQLDSIAQNLSPEVADRMALQLRPLEPEAEDASLAIVDQLQPALSVFQQAIRAGAQTSINRSATQVRDAIQVLQRLLRQAQIRLSQRDPLVAARWFAQAASTALSQRPPDFPVAVSHQDTTAVAMEQAWRNSMRQAAGQRLALTPSFRLLLGNPTAPGSSDKAAQAVGQLLPGLRQWGFLPPRQSEPIAAPMPEADTSAYQDSLKIYFQGLGKAQEAAAKK